MEPVHHGVFDRLDTGTNGRYLRCHRLSPYPASIFSILLQFIKPRQAFPSITFWPGESLISRSPGKYLNPTDFLVRKFLDLFENKSQAILFRERIDGSLQLFYLLFPVKHLLGTVPQVRQRVSFFVFLKQGHNVIEKDSPFTLASTHFIDR